MATNPNEPEEEETRIEFVRDWTQTHLLPVTVAGQRRLPELTRFILYAVLISVMMLLPEPVSFAAAVVLSALVVYS